MERALPLPWPPEGECGHRNADRCPEPGPVGPRLAVSTELTGSNQSVAEPTLPNEVVLGVLFVFFCFVYSNPIPGHPERMWTRQEVMGWDKCASGR